MGIFNFLKTKKTTIDYFKSGFSKYEIQDYFGAKEDFSKVIELDSTNSIAYLIRGKINVELKYYSKARSDFDKVIVLEPNNWDAYFFRGFSSYQDDYYSVAYSDLKKVIENTTNKEALLLYEKLIHILNTEKQKNLYLLEPDEYFKIPRSAEEIKRELDMEIDDVRVYGPFGPNYAKKLNKKASEYYEQGLFEQGINSAKDAIRNNNMKNRGYENNENASIYLNTLALGYFYIGDYDKALTTINNCIQLDDLENFNNPEHYTTRTKIILKLNDVVK
ncbi:hypothetical protein [Flavobacterium sp.]|jgi:tetratricopeptide (TPR) repeat protein|uniref:hypothetical protein n=1 Tax=Flavobacterium sp. TaxID=239 RepID=UPI0037C0E06A